jgi:isopentenyl-diphosphate Delta-isomerase
MKRLILVDERDRPVGTAPVRRGHLGSGLCHRATLTLLFDARGRLWLARRAPGKWLWPGWWDGTVAGHVLVGETYVSAARRRVFEEVGVRVPLRHAWTIRYRARWSEEAGENEMCAILVGRAPALEPDPREIDRVRAVDTDALLAGRRLVPWLRIAWRQRPRAFTAAAPAARSLSAPSRK